MEHLSIPQIADKLKISDNTVRRYMKRFKDCLPSPVKAGIVYKYPEATTELIGKIYAWYEKGLSKTEIIKHLQNGYDDTTSPSLQQPDKFDVLGGKIDALTAAITGLTTLLTSNATALPVPGHTLEAIEGLSIKLLSDPILTPDPQADTETPPEEVGDSTIQPSDRQPNTATPAQETNDSTTVSPGRQTDMEPPPKKAKTGAPATPTPTGKMEADTTTPPTGGVKNGESVKKPKEIKVETPADTLTPTGGDAILTDHVTPDMETDIEGYKRHVIELILELKGQGMILKEIKAELEGRRLKTFTGKTAWATGTIGKLYNKNK